MFEKQATVFLSAQTPVHMGAGQAIGVIDNPIQRERHTNHPVIAGSGIKGAVRHNFVSLGGDQKEIDLIFGPDANSSHLHAGAASFGDGQLVAFPIRSLRGGFVYATCPQALARVRRLLEITQVEIEWPLIPVIEEGDCVAINQNLLSKEKLHLEAFEYQNSNSSIEALSAIAKDLSGKCMPNGKAFDFFRNKFENDLVLLSDSDFTFFVENSTVVEPHVRIDEKTGTAMDGGLFYTENIPPEAIFAMPLNASKSMAPKGDSSLEAGDVLGRLKTVLNGKPIQMGGDSTTGRGWMVASAVEGK